MGRFYDLNVFFFEPDDLDTALQDSLGAYSRPLTSVSVTSELDGVGSAEVTFPVTSTYGELEIPNRICIIIYGDRWYDDAIFVGESYIIRETDTFTGPDGQAMVRMRCVSLLEELKGYQVWRPIGKPSSTLTTIATAVGAPISTTVGTGAPANNDSVILTSAAGVVESDEIRITLNNGNLFVTRITSVNPPGSPTHTVQVENRFPSNADAGNAVEIRHRRVEVAANPQDFLSGAQCVVSMNSGVHTTILDQEPDEEEGYVYLRDGLTAACNVGNAITTINWNELATDDVQQIIGYATGWTLTGSSGTNPGTKFAPDGMSVLDLLMEVQKITGEHFRLDINQSGSNKPIRRIKWVGTSEASGDTGLFTFVVPGSPADVAFYTTTVTNNTGIITGGLVRTGRRERVTRVYPFAGDPAITLFDVSPTTVSLLSAAGYTIETDPATLGLYRQPNVYDAAQEAAIGRVQSRSVTFSDIRSESESPEAIAPAADMLAIEAMSYLDRYKSAYREYQCNGVLHNCAVPLKVGQRVQLQFLQTPTGYWEEDHDTPNELLVKRITIRMGTETGGIPMWDVLLANAATPPETAGSSFASRMRTVDNLARRAASGTTTVNPSLIIGSGSGTDHSHTQYIPIAAVNDGLEYSGGELNVLLDSPDSGLAFGSGSLRMGNPATIGVSTNNTISGSNHTHFVTAVSDGQTTPGELLKTSAGGHLRTTSLSLNQSGGTHALQLTGRIAYGGTNELYFSGGSSAVINNAGQTISLISTDLTLDPSSGSVSIDAGLSLTGAARTIQTTAGNLTLDPSTGLLNVDATLSFTGGARSINTTSGDLTLEPAGDLELNPGSDRVHVQPDTWIRTTNHTTGHLGAGWGITYGGEMNMRLILADELHVLAFIADIARVSVGEHWVTPSMAELAEDFDVPTVGNSNTIVLHDIPGFENSAAFANNDYVMLRVINRDGGGLQAWLVWGQVTNYTDLADAEQSWTFTTRSLANSAAADNIASAGAILLGLGKSGDGWWRTTAIGNDTPYSEVVTWEGNPYTSGNRRTRMRLGNLKGVTGKKEWGINAGLVDSNKIVFSDLRNEIHGTRLSLYANDQATARVAEVEIRYTYDGGTTADRVPDSDDVTFQAATTGASYFGVVNSGYDSATAGSYINNEPGKSGEVWMGLVNGPSWTTLQSVSYRIRTEGSGFADDSVRAYVQIFRADQRTPLTSEELFRTYSANTSVGTGTIAFSHVDTDTVKADWDTAYIRIRWEYVATTTPEAIRLDPFVPSIAAGAPIPTGVTTGGNGFWVGRDSGVYKLRVGKPTGERMVWTAAGGLELYNSANQATIVLDSSGSSYFAREMTLGTNGGIWQGTGTFASPTTGLKIWRDGNVGRLATYNSSTLQVGIDTSGNLTAGGGAVVLNANGIRIDGANEGGAYSHVSNANQRITLRDGAGGTVGYVAGVKSASLARGVRIGAVSGDDGLNIYEGLNHRWTTGSSQAIELHPGAFGVQIGDGVTSGSGNLFLEGGLVAGPANTSVNPGQIVSDVEGAGSWQAFFLIDTTDVAHGMTAITSTNAYGRMGKNSDTAGGLLIDGLSEAGSGINLHGYASTENTGTATGSTGNVNINAFLKSGTGGGSHGSTGNLFVVRNNGSAKLILKGNGDLHVDGSSTLGTYDDYDDVALIRATDLSIASTIDSGFGAMLRYNREDVERAGLATFDGEGGVMINVTRIQRLLMGGMWQQEQRIREQDERIAALHDRIKQLESEAR